VATMMRSAPSAGVFQAALVPSFRCGELTQCASPLRVAFIGGGHVNLGGGEGPWDHATRLEIASKDVPLLFCGIAEQYVERGHTHLAKRLAGDYAELWKDCQVYADFRTMLDEVHPNCVFIGLPPSCHGGVIAPIDVELQTLRRGVHMFIEKPIACAPLAEVQQLKDRLQQADQAGVVVSVGYMFRYHSAIRKVKQLIEEFSKVYGVPKAFLGRYMCAYTTINKDMWWDVDTCGGPIVEQATHFCDLARFLLGDIQPGSAFATAIHADEPAGDLHALHTDVDELTIPVARRLPRLTTATWRFESGALGTLTHGVLLHGKRYESEIDIWGDGYRILLEDPYDKCILRVRAPMTEHETSTSFQGDGDCYLAEVLAFLNAIRSGDNSVVLSPYADAFKTYELSWQIRMSTESHSGRVVAE